VSSIARVEERVELARQHWAEGYRRLTDTQRAEPELYARLLDQVDVVTEELRRRIGKAFTLDELVATYQHADRWAAEAIADSRENGGGTWGASASTATDAAFHLYARGARDYRP
jgi:hypothetical protein